MDGDCVSSILDYVYISVFFMIFALCAIIGSSLLFQFNDVGIIPDALYNQSKGFYSALNSVGIFVLIASAIGAIGSAFMIRSHPIFLGISIFLIFIQALLAPIMVDVFNTTVQSDPAFFNISIVELELIVATIQLLPVITIIGSGVAAVVGIFAG